MRFLTRSLPWFVAGALTFCAAHANAESLWERFRNAVTGKRAIHCGLYVHTYLLPVRYVTPAVMKSELSRYLSKVGHIAVDPRTSSLLIQDRREELDRIMEVAALIDKPPGSPKKPPGVTAKVSLVSGDYDVESFEHGLSAAWRTRLGWDCWLARQRSSELDGTLIAEIALSTNPDPVYAYLGVPAPAIGGGSMTGRDAAFETEVLDALRHRHYPAPLEPNTAIRVELRFSP